MIAALGVFTRAMALVFLTAVRPSLVVLLAIAFAALWMKYLGMSANLMSLGGLAIAMGLLVDGSIVMVENVDRLLHESPPQESRTHAVVRACKEVARPIAFSLVIIVMVSFRSSPSKGSRARRSGHWRTRSRWP